MTAARPSKLLIDQRMNSCAEIPQYVARAAHINMEWPSFIDRDDLAQIAYIELWKQAGRQPQDLNNFAGFITVAMRRRIVDYRRDLLGRDKQKIGVTCTFEANIDTLDRPDPSVVAVDEFDDLRQAFHKVDLTKQEQAIVGYLLRGWKPIEIGPEIGVSRSRVSQVMTRLGEKVRPFMEDR